MKGPYERLKYDLRRMWECPVCKRRERTAPTVTFRHCNCRMKQVDGQPVVMKLVEDGVRRVRQQVSNETPRAAIAPDVLAEPAHIASQSSESAEGMAEPQSVSELERSPARNDAPS